MQLTLQDLFGEGSYQDGEKVVINKVSLPLIPSIENTSQSLLAALLEKARVCFHGQLSANGQWLTIDDIEPLEYDNSHLYPYFNLFYARNQVKGSQFTYIYKGKFLL